MNIIINTKGCFECPCWSWDRWTDKQGIIQKENQCKFFNRRMTIEEYRSTPDWCPGKLKTKMRAWRINQAERRQEMEISELTDKNVQESRRNNGNSKIT